MKKLSLFTLLLACIVGYVQAQTYSLTISGTVTDIANGNPVPNYPVDVVLDSSNFLGFSYYNTVTTDVNGNYSDVVSVPMGVSMGNGYTGTRDCTPTGYPMNTFTYTSSSTTISNLNFNICIPTGGGCNADFSSNWVQGTTVASFTDWSTANTGNITSWAWDFGDGGSSSAQNPNHAYNALGTYLVCLTISTSTGCSSTFCDSVTIGGQVINCSANLTSTVNPNGSATFSTTASGTGSIVNYFYDFGDNQTLSSQSATETHTYAVNGTYTACVYVMFSDSCVATSCATVTIGGALGCQAGYYWYPDSSGSFSIIVVNTSSPINAGTFLWTFGDGTSSTQAYPSHQYAGPGTYVVCVTISTQNPNCTSTYCDSITVINKVSAPFSINVVSNSATAVQPQLESAEVSLYPNPARDYFQVKVNLDQNEDVALTLTDLSGKLISKQVAGQLAAGAHEMRVQTQDLPAGLYLARIQVGDRVSTHKVTIAH